MSAQQREFKAQIASQQEKYERELSDKKDQIIKMQNQLEEIKKKISKQEENPNFKQDAVLQILDSEAINKYEREEEIGSGCGGRVIKVFKKKYYALKIMNIKKGETVNFRRFLREYEIINMLKHPNIIQTYGIFMSEGKNPPSILLEYCDTNLDESIQNKKLTNVDIVFTIYQIVEGMKYVHHRKIIHRDIKPSNILISSDGTIKISDFGISKLMSLDEQSTTGGVGTQKFMAPEIINEEKYDEKVDVYSFGVLIYFVLNDGDLSEIKIRNIVNGKKTPLPSKFTEFSKQLINSCWNFDPKDRPSFEQIIEDLSRNKFNLINLTKPELQKVESLVKNHKALIPSY
ncbi:hypothetical protein M9Y10_018520 [Tritrichomonas musculus]|uniref:mitogen-activated protein kinase kinase n=1 Tax=Tritrichomonas musculus TaxID=1915356 RepID=A0ABR2HMV2_9EUKA